MVKLDKNCLGISHIILFLFLKASLIKQKFIISASIKVSWPDGCCFWPRHHRSSNGSGKGGWRSGWSGWCWFDACTLGWKLKFYNEVRIEQLFAFVTKSHLVWIMFIGQHTLLAVSRMCAVGWLSINCLWRRLLDISCLCLGTAWPHHILFPSTLWCHLTLNFTAWIQLSGSLVSA